VKSNGLIEQLPQLPAGKTGWPWTKESKSLPPLMPNGKPWPKISIVTPSYNQGQFLEETIRSVLLQNYPNLEYIIMDGGSTDNSVEIIKKYAPWLTYWVSEKDNGQAAAIKKGFDLTKGDILGWLNSDDYLMSSALDKSANAFALQPDAELLVGGGIVVNETGRLLRKYYSFPQSFDSLISGGQFFMQMSSFWKREAYYAVGGLDPSLRFCFDYDLFLHLAKRRTPKGIEAILSAFRLHDQSKTSTIWETIALPEIEVIKLRYGSDTLSNTEQKELYDEVIRNYYRVTRHGILCDTIRDPRYFLRCLLNKMQGKPGNPSLGTVPNKMS
jgi:glycosyltransferase involved in cell wall biosynthesis